MAKSWPTHTAATRNAGGNALPDNRFLERTTGFEPATLTLAKLVKVVCRVQPRVSVLVGKAFLVH